MMIYLLTKENITIVWTGRICESMINAVLLCIQTLRSFIMVRNHGKNTMISEIKVILSVCSFPKVKQLGNHSVLVIPDPEEGGFT